MAVAAVGSVATQGISVAVGLQKKFSWSQVAISAAGAWASYGAVDSVGWTGDDGLSKFARAALGSFVNGGTQSLLSGQQPNWGMIAAQSFAQGVGALYERNPNAEWAAVNERNNKDVNRFIERTQSEVTRDVSVANDINGEQLRQQLNFEVGDAP